MGLVPVLFGTQPYLAFCVRAPLPLCPACGAARPGTCPSACARAYVRRGRSTPAWLCWRAFARGSTTCWWPQTSQPAGWTSSECCEARVRNSAQACVYVCVLMCCMLPPVGHQVSVQACACCHVRVCVYATTCVSCGCACCCTCPVKRAASCTASSER